MSRKLKLSAALLAISIAVTAYITYNALAGVADALEGQDLWVDPND